MREGKFGIMQNVRNFSYDVVFYLFWAPFATLMDLKSIYIFLPSIQRHKSNNDFSLRSPLYFVIFFVIIWMGNSQNDINQTI